MKKVFIAFLLLSFSKKVEPSLFVKISSDIPIQFHTPIQKAIENYSVHYHCIDTIYVFLDSGSVCKEVSGKAPLAYSTTNKISFCDNMIRRLYPEDIYNTTTHELFHAIARDTVLVEPFTILSGEIKVLGYHGLAIFVQMPDSSKTFIRTIEEGCAEVAGRGIVPNYRTYTKLYLDIGNKVAELCRYKFTLMDLVNLQKENDFPGFCAKFLQKPRDSITNKDIEKTILTFGF